MNIESKKTDLCVCGHTRANHNYYGTGHCFSACPDENGKPRSPWEACQAFRLLTPVPTEKKP